MKKLYTLLASLIFIVSTYSQTPEKMSYQAVIRSSGNNLVTSHAVGMRISILQGSSTGQVVYTETQTPSTNANGLVSIEIGGGAGFSSIEWANGPYFIKTETDPGGGTAYSITITNQLLSVPYALHAGTASSYNETDPVFNSWNKSSGIGIVSSQISNWSSATSIFALLSHNHNGIYEPVTIAGTTSQYLRGDKSWQTLNTTTVIEGANLYYTDIRSRAAISLTTTGNSGIATYVAGIFNIPGYTLSGLGGQAALNGNGLVRMAGTTVTYDNSTYLTSFTETQNLANVLTHGTDAGNKPLVNVSQQAIGTAVPAASAALDITSTTQGFLPPRLTNGQIKGIPSPAIGLMVYNTDTSKPNYWDGISWKNFDGTIAFVNVGDSYQGGKVVYLFQPGDPGYIAGQQHGLIVSAGNLNTNLPIPWSNGVIIRTTAYGWNIGTGSTNTTAIISSQGNTGNYAAKICRDFNGGGYTDWSLPSPDELRWLYENKDVIGGFANASYWTSNEFDQESAVAFDFSTGEGFTPVSKLANCYVRAVRYI